MKNEKPLLEVRPSWWNFFWLLFFFWLIIPMLVALWQRAGLVLRVYADRVLLEKGVISKSYSQLLISDIRSVDVKQGLMQRLVGIGAILIGTAGVAGYEIVAEGIPNPRGISDLLLEQRRKIKGTTD